MKYIILLLSIVVFSTTSYSQCSYESKIQEYQNKANSVGTKEASNGSQGYYQYAGYYTNLCYCEQSWSDEDLNKLVATINASVDIVNSEQDKYYTLSGRLPRMTKEKCRGMSRGGGQSTNSQSRNSTTQEIENWLRNYGQAMSLKTQGEGIAAAFAAQVAQYARIGNVSNPQELLERFSSNMAQIEQLQQQNRADNLAQIENTITTSLNNLNEGNNDGFLFSALSLIDQGEAQREAKRKAAYQKQQLIEEHQEKMSQFYWKAVELNNNAIDIYYKNAAYSYSKTDEQYNLAYVKHLQCFANSMKNNFSYSSTYWTQNNCTVPAKQEVIENNLVAKDVQYSNAAKRKWALYQETGVTDFRDTAIRFAATAANTNQKVDYYYAMGKYALQYDPIVAFTAFETVKSKSKTYLKDEKLAEYELAKSEAEQKFKEAIVNNNLEFLKAAIAAKFHTALLLEGKTALTYAIEQDKPDVVQLFLNDITEGKTQTEKDNRIKTVVMYAAAVDASEVINRMADLGFSLNFTIKGKSPIDVAVETNAIYSFKLLMNHSENKQQYLAHLQTEAADILKLDDIITNKKYELYNDLKSNSAKIKVVKALYKADKTAFFNLLDVNEEARGTARVFIGERQFRRDFYIDGLYTFIEGYKKYDKNFKAYPIDKFVEYDLLGLTSFMLKGEQVLELKGIIENLGFQYLPISLEQMRFYEQNNIQLSDESLNAIWNNQREKYLLNFRKIEDKIRKSQNMSNEELTQEFYTINHYNTFNIRYDKLIYNEQLQYYIFKYRKDEKFIRNTTFLSNEDIASYFKEEYKDYNGELGLSEFYNYKEFNLLNSFLRRTTYYDNDIYMKVSIQLMKKFPAPFTLKNSRDYKSFFINPFSKEFIQECINQKILFSNFQFSVITDGVTYAKTINEYNQIKEFIETIIVNNLTDLSTKLHIPNVDKFSDLTTYAKNTKNKELLNAFK